MADLVTVPDYLRALYRDCDGLIEFRALPRVRRGFYALDDLMGMKGFLRSHASTNLYHAVATRRDASSGELANAQHLPALYSDLDIRNAKHPKAPTEAEARAALDRCPVPPSIVTASGGGFYPFWLLREPLDLQDPGDCATAYDALRRLTAYLGADPACAEPARVLRLPNSHNRKYEPAPLVTIEQFHPSRRYNLSEITDWLPTWRADPKVQTDAHTDGSIGEGGRNAHLTSLAGSMRRRGMTEAAILAALEAENGARCHPPLDSHEVRQIASSVARYSPDQGTPSRRIALTAASQIAIRPVHWLWDGRVPLGAFGLVAGREAVGKTTVTTTIAAQITRGTLPGVYAGTPRAIAIAAAEDSWAHTIVPRLMAAGADLDLVYRVDVTTASGSECALSLPLDLVELERVIREHAIAAVVLDPLLSRLDAQLDSHKDAEVRVALEPLARLAAETNACIIGLIHINKTTSSDPLTTVMASRAFAAVARFVLFAMADPDDENRRLLGLAKNNLGRTDLPTLAYRIDGYRVATTGEGDVWTGRLEWLGETDQSIRDVMAITTDTGDRTATGEAADWLTDYLTDAGGQADSAEVKRAGKTAGHSADALKRARQKLRISAISTGFPRRTIWCVDRQSEHARGGTLSTAPTAPTGDFSHINTDYSRSNGGPVGAVGAVGRVPARGAPTGDTDPEVPRGRF